MRQPESIDASSAPERASDEPSPPSDDGGLVDADPIGVAESCALAFRTDAFAQGIELLVRCDGQLPPRARFDAVGMARWLRASLDASFERTGLEQIVVRCGISRRAPMSVHVVVDVRAAGDEEERETFFPFLRQHAPPRSWQRPLPRGESLLTLLVEAHDETATVVSMMCEPLRHGCVRARSLDEAREVLATLGERVTAVVCAASLPDGRGSDLFQWMRDVPTLRARPFVLLNNELVEPPIHDEMLHVVAKPICLARLVSVLRTLPVPPPTVSLPAPPVASPPPSPEGLARAPGAHGARILVVDDDLRFRELVVHFLERDGFTVEVAADGLAGLERARACAPSMVLLDMNMPVLDGFQFAATARADLALRDVPIVALSAYDDQRVYATGAVAHLTKPIRRDELLRVVRKVLGQPSVEFDEEEYSAPGLPVATGSDVLSAAPADVEALSRLERTLDGAARPPSDEELRPLAPGYLLARRNELIELRERIVLRDAESLRTAAHQLKGSGGAFGYPWISELGAFVADAVERARWDTLSVCVELLERFVSRAMASLNAASDRPA